MPEIDSFWVNKKTRRRCRILGIANGCLVLFKYTSIAPGRSRRATTPIHVDSFRRQFLPEDEAYRWMKD